jgi:hypothetical protein
MTISAAQSPVRPATLWIRVVSRASARVIVGSMVVSRHAKGGAMNALCPVGGARLPVQRNEP